MPFWEILFDLALIVVAAVLLGAAFARVRQSAILGYLVAGALLGPGCLHLVDNDAVVAAAAELGVVLLLFAIGLEFSWPRLRSLGRRPVYAGALQLLVTAGAVALLLAALGLASRAAVAIGAVVALSSTATVLRLLSDRAEIEGVHGRMTLGILLLQDLALIPLVLLMTILSRGGGPGTALALLGRSVLFGGLLLVAFYVLVFRGLAPLLHAIGGAGNRELAILAAVATFVLASWGAHAVGLSPALGAFVAGVLLGGSPFATQVRADVAGFRTLFVTFFFVSIGMLAEPAWVAAHAGLVAVVVAAVIAGKAVVAWLAALFVGLPTRHAVAVGICLAQVGELSFVLVAIAFDGALVGGSVYRLVVNTTLVTLFLTPFLVAAAPRLGQWLERLAGRRGVAPAASDSGRPTSRDHVIVVGFGPAGRGAARAQEGLDVTTVVVELNPRAVAAAVEGGFEALVGDATQAEVLESVDVHAARAVVVTIPDHLTAGQVVRQVRALSPAASVIVRARHHVFAAGLQLEGAEVVVDEEEEVGRLLGEAVRRLLRGDSAGSA